MELINIIFLIGLVFGGLIDYKQKQLPDVLIAFLWGVCFFLPSMLHGWLIGLFALSVFVNSLPSKPMFGWGDLLLFPVWFVAIWNTNMLIPGLVFGSVIYFVCVIGVGYLDAYHLGINDLLKKQRIAVAPFFLISYSSALFFSLKPF